MHFDLNRMIIVAFRLDDVLVKLYFHWLACDKDIK